MKFIKPILASLIMAAAVTPVFAAVAGRCSRTVIVVTQSEVISCDLSAIYVDGGGNIVACEYTC